MIKQGTIFYDRTTKRYDVHFDTGGKYGGLHCGDTLDVLINGKWVPARIEMAADWYLVGCRDVPLDGLRVRI